MAALDQPVEAYLSQLHAIQIHDTRNAAEGDQGADHWCWPAPRTS